MTRLSFLFLFAMLALGCETQQAISQSASRSDRSEMQSRPVSDFFIDGDRLLYRGYELVKLKKKVREEYPPAMKSRPQMIDVSYAVLKKNGRTLATFDGVTFSLGNTNEFGLFPFLGGETKHLLISQTIPRGGRHWIVSVSPDFRIIYDGGAYGLGREEMAVLDLDNDGVYEITQELTRFVFFAGITRGATHLVDIAFKYDEKAKEYLPASHVFQDYTLSSVKDKSVLDRRDERTLAFDVLRFMLPYIYAGKRDEAWEFYEREYTFPDKKELKAKVMAALEADAVYKFIYR